MPYMTDLQRVEMSLPVHIMLAVLISGADSTEPMPPTNTRDPYYLAELERWSKVKERWDRRVESDPEFAASVKTFKETRGLLMAACDEALSGVYPEYKMSSLLRRIHRVHKEIVTPYIKDNSGDPRKIGIIAYYLLQHLVDTGLLIVPEDSAFGKALAHLLPALSPTEQSTDQEVADYDALNRSAQKQVRKILINLQNNGYYRGISIPDYEIMAA